MSHSKVWTSVILVSSILACLALNGCARQLVLHPIEKSDIQPMEKGKCYAPEKNGFFLSDEYMKEVIETKVK